MHVFIKNRTWLGLSLVLLVGLTVGCGNKGDLYLDGTELLSEVKPAIEDEGEGALDELEQLEALEAEEAAMDPASASEDDEDTEDDDKDKNERNGSN